MKTDDIINILNAYKKGKIIQVFDIENGNWEDIECMEEYPFNFSLCYRIKPKILPYRSSRQFINEMGRHLMYVVNKKDNSIKYYPLEVREEGVMIPYKEKPTLISWYALLRDFEWEDGSMCGFMDNEKRFLENGYEFI